jgi:hypothetical protein
MTDADSDDGEPRTLMAYEGMSRSAASTSATHSKLSDACRNHAARRSVKHASVADTPTVTASV